MHFFALIIYVNIVGVKMQFFLYTFWLFFRSVKMDRLPKICTKLLL